MRGQSRQRRKPGGTEPKLSWEGEADATRGDSLEPVGEAERRREWILVAVVLAIGCFLRIFLAIAARQDVTSNDDLDYLRRGLYFARGGANDVWRAPLQIWFIGLTMRLTNYNFLVTRVLQAFLSCGMLPFTYLTARRLLRFRYAFLVLVAVTAWPEFYTYSFVLVSEGICMSLVCLAVWLTLVAVQRPASSGASSNRVQSLFIFLLAGMAWGVAALSRDEFFLIALTMCVPIYLVLRDWKKTTASFAALLVGLTLVVAPYTARNLVRRHAFALITNHATYNLWEHWNDQLSKGAFAKEYWSWPEPQRQARALEKAVQCLEARPGFVFLQGVRSFARMFQPETYGFIVLCSGWLGNPSSPVSIVYFVGVMAMVLVALIGYAIGFLMTWRKGEYWIFHIMIAASLLMHAIAFGQGRYRLPWMPFLLLVSVIGWREVFLGFAKHRGKIIVGSLVALAVYLGGLGILSREYESFATFRQTLIQNATVRRLPKQMETHFREQSVIFSKRAAAWREKEKPPPKKEGSLPAK